MKIGVTTAFNHFMRPEFMIESAQALDAAGIHSMWVPEHVVFFPEYASRYPYSEDGRIPGEPEGVLDPFTALTFVAAHTNNIRLGTGICLVPQRQPIYTAKMVADLDYLSGGRVDFGVGIGWLEEEFDSLQMSFKDRAKRCNEYVDAMKALWAPGVTQFDGPTVNISGALFNPKPVQSPHPPIFFGGESEPALRRVASRGDGWYGFNLNPETLAERLGSLEQKLADQGRTRADIQVFVGPGYNASSPDDLKRFRDLGVDQIILPAMAGKIDKLHARIEKILAISAA